MKNIKTKISVSIIIFVGLISAVCIYKTRALANTMTVTATSNAELSFAVLGDVHENIDDFEDAIKDLYSINSNMDTLVLNGDTVDQGLEEQYTSVKNTLRKYKNYLPETIIKNIGNHEFFDYDIEVNSAEQVQTFINNYLEFSGEEKVYHDTWIKNYHFISLGSEDGNSETLDSIAAYISDQQLNWFKEKLAENYQNGKPIFVFLHQPLYYGGSNTPAIKQSEEVREILEQYPEAILFTSHTHRDLTESTVALNQPYTWLTTGSIHYTIVPDQSSENGRRMEYYTKGLYIEVNGNNVVIKGRDIMQKQWIFTKEISKQ